MPPASYKQSDPGQLTFERRSLPASLPSRSFAAGDTVPESGVYRAVHRQHRPPHTLVALKGELFPACRTCGAKVSFELVESVPHATHDWDFAGPSPSLVLVKGDKHKKKKA